MLVQNACAKAITGVHQYDSASEQLATLHWLPVKHSTNWPIARIIIYKPKLATVGYRSFNAFATPL